jgi:hypothetical protein
VKIFLAKHRQKPVAVVISLHKIEARRLILEQAKWNAVEPEEMILVQIGYSPKNAKSGIVLQVR